jgi:hypothetical protein
MPLAEVMLVVLSRVVFWKFHLPYNRKKRNDDRDTNMFVQDATV